MSSLSNTQINTRSMNGLVNVEANSGIFDDIECNTINIAVQGNTPTPPLLDNSTKIATTAFVLTHSSGNFVDLTTSQTIVSGVKTFNTLPQSSAVPSLGDQMVNKTFTDATYVDFVNNEIISGEKTFSNANTYINNTLTADIITATGDLTLNPIGSINCNGKTIDMTGGEIHKCPLIHSQNNNNIVVEGLGTGDVVLKTNGIDRITVADNGISTFSTLPECSISATSGNQLTNRNYVDNAISGSSLFATLAGSQTFTTGIKTFTNLPQSSAVPSLGDDLTNKTFTDATYVDFTNAESISGIKTFTNGIVSNSINATTNSSSQSLGSNLTTGSVNIGNAITTGIITIGNALTSGIVNIATGLAGFVNIMNNSSAGGTLSVATNSGAFNTSQIIMGKNTAISIDNDTGSVNLSTAKTTAGTLTICTDATSTRTVNIGRNNAIAITNGATTTTAITGTVNINTGTGTTQIGSNSASSNTDILGVVDINASGLSTQDTNIGNLTGLLTIAGRINIIPAGTIIMGLYTTAPTGYVKCDGTSYATTGTYANLFAVIGYNYGGAGASFNVIDLTGAFIRGSGTQTISGIAYTGGALSSAGRQQDMALTTPLATYTTPFSSTGFRSCAGGTRDCLARTSQGDPAENPTGLNLAYPAGRGGTEVRPFNYSVNYWIRI